MSESEEVAKDFIRRFQQAENLPKAKKGIIFIGNTRAGKSTLACAGAGGNMEIYYDNQSTLIRPTDQKYLELVKKELTLTSVTETPNFFQPNPQFNKFAIIDMPGYADTSRLRELINFHYISTMTSNLQQVRFLLVVSIQIRNKKFQMDPHELQMMQAFMQMFPNCGDCVSLVVNKLEDKENNAKIESQIKKYLMETFNNRDFLKKYVKKPDEMKKYFQKAYTGNIVVIRRPVYKEGPKHESQWSEPCPHIRITMRNLCNDEKSQFMTVKDLSASLNIFKEGDTRGNTQFCDTLRSIVHYLNKIIREGLQKYVQALTSVTLSVLSDNHDLSKEEESLQMFLQHFVVKNKNFAEGKGRKLDVSKYNCQLQLTESRLLKLYRQITIFAEENQKKIAEHNDKQREILQFVHCIYSQLALIVKGQHSFSKQFQNLIGSMHLLLIRSVEQIFFICNTVLKYSHTGIQNISEIADELNYQTYQQFKMINKGQDRMKLIKQPFQKLFHFFINIDLRNYSSTKQLNSDFKTELVNSLKIVQNLYYNISSERNTPEKIAKQIENKIEEIDLFFLIDVDPGQNEGNIKKVLKELLKKYLQVDRNDIKFKLIVKIASYLERIKEYKSAVALYFHLEVYEFVMKLLAQITEAKECKKEDATEWFVEFAKEFIKKGKGYYFELCIEKAKVFSFDKWDKLIQLQEQLVRGGDQILKKSKLGLQSLEKSQINQKIEYWDLNRLNEEILFLSYKFGLQGLKDKKPPAKSVVAGKLREK